MAFVKKTWKDRIAEFPTRRRLTKEDNTSELVTVAREEGTLSQEGDAFSAENMNDLENRIDAEFTEVNGKLQLDFGIETKAIDVTTGSDGLTYIGGQLILAVTSDTPDTNITFFNNAYGMWYVKILKSSTGQPYVGNFRLYVLKLIE